jgi:hypothetical protein
VTWWCLAHPKSADQRTPPPPPPHPPFIFTTRTRVERRRGLIKDEQPRPPQQRAREDDALPLAARQQLVGDARLVALRQRGDELVRVGVARGGLDVGVGRGPRAAVADVGRDVERQQLGLLRVFGGFVLV